MKRRIQILLSLIVIVIMVIISGCTNSNHKQSINSENQKKVDELSQIAMHYYWNGGDLKKVEKEFFKGITLKGKFDVVENSFEEAIKLEPYRLNLRFSLASTQIILGKVDEALKTYKEILDLDTNNFDANILYAAYSRVNGDEKTYEAVIKKLHKINAIKVKEYEESFARTESFLKTSLNTKAYSVRERNHTIVTLGYVLANDGTMRPTLIKRLEQTLAMARLNPEANIIVTGGVPKGGVTEAYLMRNWLISKGIDAKRIFIDDQAKDTVGNAVYSTEIMKSLGTEYVTLISSASHIRRGLSVFKEVSVREGINIDFGNLVYLDYDSVEDAQKVSQKEYMVVYRDTLRGSGLWNYPGRQR